MAVTSARRLGDLAARAFVVALAAIAVGWAASTLPLMARQRAVVNIAKHIIQGDAFKDDALNAMLPVVDAQQDGKWTHPSVLSSAAIIKLRVLERAIADGDQAAIDRQMTAVNRTIRISLTETPADPFLWLVLFWLENTQNGFSRDHLKYLQMSYALGPNEGWIAVRRNRLALAVFPQLTPELREHALVEFARLVDSNFIAEAADILTGPGWPIRGQLLPRLRDVADVNRQIFAKRVYRLGYDVVVPGVERPEFRPWN